MRFGNNSIFAMPMSPFSLSNTVYNHKVATNPNPLYYNTDGHFFLQVSRADPHGCFRRGITSSNLRPSVTGMDVACIRVYLGW
eukprot:31849-Eustigmatos_ZCMA.PRE.1